MEAKAYVKRRIKEVKDSLKCYESLKDTGQFWEGKLQATRNELFTLELVLSYMACDEVEKDLQKLKEV